MGAIPSSHLPGHGALHDRVTTALDRCIETPAVDFKESAVWAVLEFRIIRTCLAMANLRDGGVVVIGVAERNGAWVLDGIDPTDLKTYDPDTILDAVNRFASPVVEIEVVAALHQGKTFLAVAVAPFKEAPIVCKRDNQRQGAERLERGTVYVRPYDGSVRTTKVLDARHMHELLEIATEYRVAQFIETAKRTGAYAPGGGTVATRRRFDDELGGL